MQRPDSCISSSCTLEQSNDIKSIELSVGESSDPIEICACRSWNRSGIRVAEGQRYIFEIAIITENWKDGSVDSDPKKGWKGRFMNSIGYFLGFLKRSNKTNWYALVGAVGKSDEYTFAILNEYSNLITLHESGELYFYANDMYGRYFNNTGCLQLKLARTSDYIKN